MNEQNKTTLKSNQRVILGRGFWRNALLILLTAVIIGGLVLSGVSTGLFSDSTAEKIPVPAFDNLLVSESSSPSDGETSSIDLSSSNEDKTYEQKQVEDYGQRPSLSKSDNEDKIQSNKLSLMNIISTITEELPDFAPHGNTTESLSNQNESKEEAAYQDPYAMQEENADIERGYNISENKAKIQNELNNYRLFLANANNFIVRYKEGKLSDEDIFIFNSVDHPQAIKNILSLMTEHNRKPTEAEFNTKNALLEFVNTKPFNKFIKITIISDVSKSKQRLRERIDENLPMLINYIYSPQLQENFIKLD